MLLNYDFVKVCLVNIDLNEFEICPSKSVETNLFNDNLYDQFVIWETFNCIRNNCINIITYSTKKLDSHKLEIPKLHYPKR